MNGEGRLIVPLERLGDARSASTEYEGDVVPGIPGRLAYDLVDDQRQVRRLLSGPSVTDRIPRWRAPEYRGTCERPAGDVPRLIEERRCALTQLPLNGERRTTRVGLVGLKLNGCADDLRASLEIEGREPETHYPFAASTHDVEVAAREVHYCGRDAFLGIVRARCDLGHHLQGISWISCFDRDLVHRCQLRVIG